jgi:hypothetical protein
MILTLIALAAATPAATEPADPKDKIKCVREEIIGSLVGMRRVCHTIAEWEVISRTRADNARQVVGDTQISQSNGNGG